MNHKNSQAGFSLMEILVALAIMLVAGVAVVTMLTGAGKQSGTAAVQARQNGNLRNAMDTLQRSIKSADRPLIKVGRADGTSEGDELIYYRTEDRGAQGAVHLVERVYYDSSSGSIILQRKGYEENAKPSSSTVSQSSFWTDLPRKVLLTNFQTQDSGGNPAHLFTYYAKTGQPSKFSTDGTYDAISLIDVNLRTDQDGASGNLYPQAALNGTVYLEKLGTNTTSSGSPVGC